MSESTSSTGSLPQISVLMVCLGNICRSPMAEAVFADLASKRSALAGRIKVDSAGTAGYHGGDDPDERTVETCRKHKIPINCTARSLQTSDFYNFTHIIAMDTNNLRNINSLRPASSPAQVSLFSTHSLAHDPSSSPISISDPYYGSGMSGFERCYKQCVEYSEGFLTRIERGEVGSVEKGEDDVKGKKDKGLKAGL